VVGKLEDEQQEEEPPENECEEVRALSKVILPYVLKKEAEFVLHICLIKFIIVCIGNIKGDYWQPNIAQERKNNGPNEAHYFSEICEQWFS